MESSLWSSVCGPLIRGTSLIGGAKIGASKMTQYRPGEYDDGNRIISSLSHTLLTLLSKNRGTVFQFFLGNNFILQAQLILVSIYIYGSTHQAL